MSYDLNTVKQHLELSSLAGSSARPLPLYPTLAGSGPKNHFVRQLHFAPRIRTRMKRQNDTHSPGPVTQCVHYI